jgi:hypothetical protein
MKKNKNTDYKISFRQSRIIGTWSYIIKTPDGRRLYPVIMGTFAMKESAERDALRRINLDRATYEMTGTELATKYNKQES